jgi:hypothetical protein
LAAWTASPFAERFHGDLRQPVESRQVMIMSASGDPWTGLADGASRGIRLLAGHNRDEWRLFLAAAGQGGPVTEQMTGMRGS